MAVCRSTEEIGLVVHKFSIHLHLIVPMAPPPATQNRNRRRKKRRTEDFSSDSDSLSDSDNEQVQKPEQEQEQEQEQPQPQAQVNIDDIDIESDSEKPVQNSNDPLLEETKQQLQKVKFTNTENLPLSEAKQAVSKDRAQLENEYLAFMAGEFAEDLDELRKKPDFTEKSIVMLAKTLQSGANMFDDETLEALLK